jgi:hypothetical protein
MKMAMVVLFVVLTIVHMVIKMAVIDAGVGRAVHATRAMER